ncbi:MAG: DUF3726 domain-containing protein, partial [Pseudomonadota bacterium]
KSSMNELQGLLKRSFEALFAHRLDFEQCAEDVAWLQARGFRGVQALCQSLTRLEQISKSGDLPALSWTGATVVDASQSSLLIAAPHLIDFVIAEATNRGDISLEIHSADKPVTLMPGLARLAELKVSAFVSWQEAGSNERHEAVLLCGEDQAAYRRVRTATTAATGMLNLHASSRPTIGAPQEPGEVLEEKNAQKLQELFAKSIHSGVEVPDPCYEKLSAVANRLLVEASEQSRRGAGA